MAQLLYSSAKEYLKAPRKSVALFGMSGLGKTHLSNLLRQNGDWFHYSVDYRIGARYMAEPIADYFKREAMKVPVLRELLLSDSINIQSNLSFENLTPLANYLGKPGDPQKGGIEFSEYCRRQGEHRHAEIAAMGDIPYFQRRAEEIYGYLHFIADCSGSLCEVVNADSPDCDVMSELAKSALPVWIEGPKSHREELIHRFKRAPKPMYYQPDFLEKKWDEYLKLENISADQLDPNDFIIWGYSQLLDDRLPRYQAMAENWGITVQADEVSAVKTAEDFNALIASKLG